MGRKILAVLAGMITGGLIVMIFDELSHLIAPPPEGLDFTDKEAITEFMKTVPVSAFLVMLAGWLLSAFSGAFVASKIVPLSWKSVSLLTGGILMLGAIMNMVMLPHPVWMMVIGILGYFPLAWLGGKLAGRNDP